MSLKNAKLYHEVAPFGERDYLGESKWKSACCCRFYTLKEGSSFNDPGVEIVLLSSSMKGGEKRLANLILLREASAVESS